jgi:molybdopterin-guanine dinucleotide biosynthesis protein A
MSDTSIRSGGPLRPLNGGVLIGGDSRRMGRSKARLAIAGVTLLQRACDELRNVVGRVAVLGDDGHPRDIAEAVWLDDMPGVRGPLAGILAAMDIDPAADWLIVACDMPSFDRRALDWLMEQHRPAAHATFAHLPGRPRPEPLLAIYSASAANPLRAAAAAGEFAMHRALARLKARVVPAPASLSSQWRNANTPGELDAIRIADLRDREP